MTGSLYHRQISLAEDYSNKNKMPQPKFRRCLSVENKNLFALISDNHQNKTESFFRRDQTASDNDSGIEDGDQQIVNSACLQSNNTGEKESSTHLSAYEDGYLENDSNKFINKTSNYCEQSVKGFHGDMILASKVPDDQKKLFCSSTCEIFHGDFTLRVLYPLFIRKIDTNYCLLPENEIYGDPCRWPNFAFVKLDNAKAQFKCPNSHCGRSWTSMRARISFKISYPQQNGFVVMKIYGQVCQVCETIAEARWYSEEVCRVMKNLAESLFMKFFPTLINQNSSQNANTIRNDNQIYQRSRHDANQRMGKMNSQHDRIHCEACLRGFCFR
ncbi:unnamed protein product [Rotaria socialis]|uniref:3CxxC-type domain-containing protein n=1 Tax=Rotaria socialis TaxID=392032 RepID=A0A821BYH1_9BILA|nr:unnamed protein product [Rotaria socialis]CAF3305140.1 unnamed protein product [Rotaria socialis]CAF4420765.1 unnamed protein product [Rotaria socialis]CAF4597440.1 unnamed protein product [Rotaria socialis]